jgi:hypothetical protein
MGKPLLNAEGVQEKLREGHALSEGERIFHAKRIAEDFKKWTFENFEVMPMQKEYLENLPESVTCVLGCQLASALVAKQDIEMKFEPVPAKENSNKNVGGSISTTIGYEPTTGKTTLSITGIISFNGKK